MMDLEEKLAMFHLGDQSVRDALHTIELVKGCHRGPSTYTVETIVVLDGEAKVVAKENRNV